MPHPIKVLKGRPLMALSLALGVALFVALPSPMSRVTRALCAWDVGVWLYLVATAVTMLRADHHRLRRNALLHSEGLTTVTAFAACAVAASMAAIALELSQAKSAPGGVAWPHVLFAFVTIVGSWLLLPMLFGLAYASLFYDEPEKPGGGLAFPGPDGPRATPDYADFLYFSITLAATSQTSDVAITDPEIRRWVTVQAVLSFAFNTTLLALAVNIAAGLL
jgi:uncharacterized membrane protein